MGEIIFLIIIICIVFIKKVPPNTAIIIDRNKHYLKTKRGGFYFFNPATDKITTKISTNSTYKFYTNNFQTNDAKIAQVSFNVTYNTNSIESVLDSLKSARRSVDDIMNASIYWAVNNLNLDDFLRKPDVLLYEVKSKLLAEATELNIKISKFNITNINQVPNSPATNIFKPHLSSHSCGPIKYK